MSLVAAVLLAAVGAVAVSPGRADAAPPPVRTAASAVQAASVLHCPSFSPTRLPSAVGVAAVNIGGCPGYWVANSYGQVSSYGSAQYYGGIYNASAHIVGITATTDGRGYWLVGADGAVYSFGDAVYYGGANNLHLNGAILGISVTQDGRGYWLDASDGGIFSYGDAQFSGSMGGRHLNQPVDGMAVAPGGAGYWLVASDGGVFTFTNDGFYGSMGGTRLNKPVIGVSGTPDGRGYTLVASDGGVFNFGDSQFYGSLGASPPPSPIVDLSPVPANDGYYVLDSAGQVFPFGPGTYVPSTLTMSVPAIPTAQVGSAYSALFGASGGSAPYIWTSSGTLPPGLTLAGGALSGTPTQQGTYTFNVTVADSGAPTQSTTASVTVQVNPRPATALGVTTTALSVGDAFQPYQASLSATGGIPAYTWSLVSGALPTGLTLSTAGGISGTPSSTGTFDFTVQVRDSAGSVATASYSLLVAPTSTYLSSNWSGYVMTGGPFTGVHGTFNVPSLTNPTQSGEAMAEWVGIDGFVNGTNDLIQAGIELDPTQGGTQSFTVTPWWEILPAAETPISTMAVSAGDQVTVDINRVSGLQWQITVTDDTKSQSFTTDQTYSGPTDSAEWIVEAPTSIGSTGQATQTSMAPYSPDVLFTNLQSSQTVSGVDNLLLVDPYTGAQTSTPSNLDSTGFNVAYGATAPPAP